MVPKVFLSFAIAVFVCNHATGEGKKYDQVQDATCTRNISKLQRETFREMVRNTNELWEVTPPMFNIQFFPLVQTINKNMALIYTYYRFGWDSIFSKNRFLEGPYELANQIKKIEILPNVKLRFAKAMFYDEKDSNETYVSDIRTRYQADPYMVTLIGNNTEPINRAIYKWLRDYTRGRVLEKELLVDPTTKEFFDTILRFTACWNKTSIETIEVLAFNRYGRSFTDAVTIARAFSSIEFLPYWSNERLKYEAIRFSFRNRQLVMTVVMPYEDQPFNQFVQSFTLEDYKQIVDPVNVTRELVYYAVPKLDIAMVRIDEYGININGANVTGCPPYVYPTEQARRKYSKRFFVDRPYGLFIYHENTKFVIWQAWIRDPTSQLYLRHMPTEEVEAYAQEAVAKATEHVEQTITEEPKVYGKVIAPNATRSFRTFTEEPLVYGKVIEPNATRSPQRITEEPPVYGRKIYEPQTIG